MKKLLFALYGASFCLLCPSVRAQTVGHEADKAHGCTTRPVRSLARQFARAQTCLFPDALVEVKPGSGLTFASGAAPYTSPQTRDALYKARKSASFQINSAFRTLLEQYYLSTATAPACGAVAPPGTSNHESGSAVDVQQWDSARRALTGAGCVWPNIRNDPWHFNCPPFGAKKRTVLAFQKLWNLNHPKDRIDEDGSFGPQTRARLRKTPMSGFAYDGCGPNCTTGRGDNDECAEQLLPEQPVAYAPPTTTDVNGDGRADLCARGAAGFTCWPSVEGGWAKSWEPVAWSDEAGWDRVARYASIRMGDIDGDGQADACARAETGLECALSTGVAFASPSLWNEEVSDAAGWSEPSHYATLRLADIDGDGRDDLCGRAQDGFGCWLSDGSSFSNYVEGPAWSDDNGHAASRYYGTLRMGDLDGDGLADVCMRGADGVRCARSTGVGFDEAFEGPAWSDAEGFSGREYWSTLRLSDVNGDSLDDLCIRTSEDYRCQFSMGQAFDAPVTVAALADTGGWSDPTNYGSIRLGDIDGDGANDICARGNEGLRCWRWNGASFDRIEGPGWADDSAWNQSKYYQTIRVGDFDADGLADVCARAAKGWRCHPSDGTTIADAVPSMELEDSTGWGAQQYWSTILFGSYARAVPIRPAKGTDGGVTGEPKLTSTCGLRQSTKPWPSGLALLALLLFVRARNKA